MTNSHKKPSKEELEAQEKAAIEEAEKLEKNPPEEEPEPDVDLSDSDTDSEPEEEPKEEVEDKAEEQAEPSKELYKKKFSASSRENQRINAKNRVINNAIIEAESIPEPTEEEMKSIYKDDWDVMSEIEKDLAKETVHTRKWRAKIKDASDQATKIEKWTDSVNEFVDDPKTLNDNPDLEGKTDEFKEFATRDENNNVPFSTLIGAFLYEYSKNKTSNKGRMFERAKGGANDRPEQKGDKISLEEARKLRVTNYTKWKELNAAGKIDYNL